MAVRVTSPYAHLSQYVFSRSLTIDQLVIKRNPIVAGAGIGMFAGTFGPVDFELVDTQTFDTGTQITTLRRRRESAGEEGAGTA